MDSGSLPRSATAVVARQDIPAHHLTWYIAAAWTCPSLTWSVLANIREVATNHGRPGLLGIRSGSKGAGAEGPMQLRPAIFARHAVNAGPDHLLSPDELADAIYTAARMLRTDGTRSATDAGIQQAIFAYDHASWFVTGVLAWAVRYASKAPTVPAATTIAFAQAQLGKPNCWGGPGPSCSDCGGLVVAMYATAGIYTACTTYRVPSASLLPITGSGRRGRTASHDRTELAGTPSAAAWFAHIIASGASAWSALVPRAVLPGKPGPRESACVRVVRAGPRTGPDLCRQGRHSA
jgi:hypothetical protein